MTVDAKPLQKIEPLPTQSLAGGYRRSDAFAFLLEQEIVMPKSMQQKYQDEK